MSRDLSKADQFLAQVIRETILQAKQNLLLDVFVVDVDRDYKIQRAYYAQGRENTDSVNALRKMVNLPSITEKQNVKITWTMNSKHITNLDDNNKGNDLSRAVDIGLKDKNNRYIGNSDIDMNGDEIKDYEQVGLLAEKIGQGKIKWGGRFKDPAHIELV